MGSFIARSGHSSYINSCGAITKMNILGLVFSASSLFQQTDRQTSFEKNDLRTKSPSVTATSRPLENNKKKASHTKCQKLPSDYGCSKKSSGHLNGFSGGLIDVSNTSDRPSTLSHDDAKRTSKKKKKKKAKLNKPHLDNSIALEAIVISKNSLSTELLVDVQSNATACDKTAKELISKSVHDKADAMPDSISSELALTSAGSSIITSVIASEPASAFSEDASDKETKSASTVSSSADNFNHITQGAPRNENCRSTETFEEGSNVVSFGMGRSSSHNEVTADTDYHITQPIMEPPCSRSLSADPKVCCRGNIHKASGTKEAEKYGRRKDVKSSYQCSKVSYQCSKVSDIPPVVTIQNPLGVEEADKRTSNMKVTSSNQGSAVPAVSASDLNKENSLISNSTSRLPHHMNNRMKIGKENANFTWKRTGRYIGNSQTDGRKISDPNHLCLDAASSGTTSVIKHSSSEGDGLLPPSHFCNYMNDSFQQKVKYPGASIQKMQKSQGHISGEAYEWVTRESSHSRCGQTALRPRNDIVGNRLLERSKNKLFPPPKQDNNNHGRKGSWVSKPNLCKAEMGPKYGTGTTSTESGKPELFHLSLIGEDKSAMCSGIELQYDSTMKEFASRDNLSKWIPVSKMEPVVLKASTDIDNTNIEKVDKHQEVDNGVFIGASSFLYITKDVHKSNVCGGQGNLGKDRSYYCFASDCKLNFPQYVCSDLAEKQSLKASYASQIASENFHLATGSPIAEFEKLLYSASPVIDPFRFHQQFDSVVEDEPTSDSFIKFLKLSIALQDVWNWYEGPGNYGLQVKAEDSQKGLGANLPFHAHFAPFLSAIQIFGHPHSVGSTSGNTADLISKRVDTEESPSPASALNILSHELVAETCSSDAGNSKECTRSSGVATSDGSGCSTSASSGCLSDGSHVIFEYFEQEPPQLRKPLFSK